MQPGGAGTRRIAMHGLAFVVLVVGLILAAVLSFTARVVHDNNEDRLLRQRAHEAATALGATTANVVTPLSSGAVLAEVTNANRAELTELMAPPISAGQFVSVSVWPAHAPDPRPLFVLGAQPELSARPPADIRAFLDTAGKGTLSVLDLLTASPRRLGYGLSAGPKAKFIVYAEANRPRGRRSALATTSAFANLDYAIYLGTAADSQQLLASSTLDPRFTGRTASDTIPFGNAQLDLVMTPRRELGGDFLARLSLLIAGLGIALAAAAALLTERLVLRRADAEGLALLNAQLFSEQRSVAQTLQHSLLPPEPHGFEGLELAARYVPGVDDVDIGGDWYDIIDVGAGKLILVVGDVSGRGLRAATVMASLRYAIRAYAAQGDAPDEIVFKLSKLIDVRRDGHFATVLCGLVDVLGRTVSYANAGHPAPLLVNGANADFVSTNVGAPVGVASTRPVTTTVSVPHDGILVAFTDGLFERRGENPDTGLTRLRDAAHAQDSLDDLLDDLLHTLTPEGGSDDTAILAVRWTR